MDFRVWKRGRTKHEDYGELKEKISVMQDEIAELQRHASTLKAELRELMDDYFKHECMVVMLKRDRREIVAEIRKQMEKNLMEGLE